MLIAKDFAVNIVNLCRFIKDTKVDFIYEVRYVMDGVYLLVENGLPSQMMIKVK